LTGKETARERTNTFYLDKEAFRRALELPHEEDIYVLLVDRRGAALWQATGALTQDKATSQSAAIG
jgi:hypothetical protein